jgi:hypothetical protein
MRKVSQVIGLRGEPADLRRLHEMEERGQLLATLHPKKLP